MNVSNKKDIFCLLHLDIWVLQISNYYLRTAAHTEHPLTRYTDEMIYTPALQFQQKTMSSLLILVPFKVSSSSCRIELYFLIEPLTIHQGTKICIWFYCFVTMPTVLIVIQILLYRTICYYSITLLFKTTESVKQK